MKINNISAKTPKKLLITTLLFCIILTIVILLNYSISNQVNYSISSFLNWYITAFNSAIASKEENLFIIWFVFIILPIMIYGSLIYSIYTRHKAIKELNSKLNLKSVEFLQGKIHFKFNQPNFNIIYQYSDIKSLKMIIHTVQVYNKHGSYPAISEIELKFSILNNETFIVKNTPINVMKFIYSIIDYSRNMQFFSYCFQGYAELEDIKEKIEDYHRTGIKQILSSHQERNYKTCSLITFIIAITVLFSMCYKLDESSILIVWPVLLFPGIIAFISFIYDFILIADKIKERKYKI